jgi:hypothetical protein
VTPAGSISQSAGRGATYSPTIEPSRQVLFLERGHAAQDKSWELRAAMSLARLLARPGQGVASARTVGSGVRVVYGGV